jgi:hypothetical protein
MGNREIKEPPFVSVAAKPGAPAVSWPVELQDAASIDRNESLR